MRDTANTKTIARLIAIKREELDRYRQDLGRLEKIVDAARARLHTAREGEQVFLEETRQAEHARKSLDAMAMIQRRHYLLHLRSRTAEQQGAFDQADEQRDQAHRCLEKAFAEIRTLERLAERRIERAQTERQRVEYLHADDQEIARDMHGRDAHGHH